MWLGGLTKHSLGHVAPFRRSAELRRPTQQQQGGACTVHRDVLNVGEAVGDVFETELRGESLGEHAAPACDGVMTIGCDRVNTVVVMGMGAWWSTTVIFMLRGSHLSSRRCTL